MAILALLRPLYGITTRVRCAKHISFVGARYLTIHERKKLADEKVVLKNIHVARPSREDFATINKYDPIFFQYLKQITEQEKRFQDYKDFENRCREGLEVPKYVYVTKEELYKNMWENGYSDDELKFFTNAFPDGHCFHYPELAVLFNLSEEDCYKYALKVRGRAAITTGELAEIKKKPLSLILPFGIATTVLWLASHSNVLFNMWFLVKTWPIAACAAIIIYNYKDRLNAKWFEEIEEDEKIFLKNKLDSEDQIYAALAAAQESEEGLKLVEDFVKSLDDFFHSYKMGLLLNMRDECIQSTEEYLNDVCATEHDMETQIKNAIVNDVVEACTLRAESSSDFKNTFMEIGLSALENLNEERKDDPVLTFSRTVLKQLQINSPEVNNIFERTLSTHKSLQKQFADHFSIS